MAILKGFVPKCSECESVINEANPGLVLGGCIRKFELDDDGEEDGEELLDGSDVEGYCHPCFIKELGIAVQLPIPEESWSEDRGYNLNDKATWNSRTSG